MQGKESYGHLVGDLRLIRLTVKAILLKFMIEYQYLSGG